MRCVVFFHLPCGMTDGSSAYNSGMKTAKYLRRHRKLIGFLAILLSIAMTAGVCLYALTQTAAGSTRLTIVIDAGHGGIDGGVVGRTTGEKESDINLAISQFLQAEFEEAGFLVVQTRPTQAGLYGSATQGYKKRDMQKRAEIIEASAPAAVISVHQNFFSLSSRRGAQVFFREDNALSHTLACAIQAALNGMPECVRPSDALKGDYYMLNCSDYPSVIVECGFLSNPEDEALLLSENYQRRIAETICEGTLAFLSAASSAEPAMI